MKKTVLMTCFFVIFLAISCAVNPVTGKRELNLVSEQQEIALGKETDVAIKKQYGIYDDPALNSYVKSIGRKLTSFTHRPQLEYHFAVLDTPVVNAFAVPGGYIYVTRGILAMMNSEAELAVILGHELGHVNARHSARKMSQLMLAQLGLAVGSAIDETFAKYSGLASIGIQLLFLKFSRDDERQADALGVEYARKGNYNPGEMIDFFASLQKLGDLSGGRSLPGFLSTHPLSSERIENVNSMLSENDKQLDIKGDNYLQQLDNIIFGDDPKQGYVEGNTFFHPGMRFFFSFPSGWKFQNTPSQVTIVSQDGKAAIILQAEKTSETLNSYAQKKASTLEGKQFINEQSRAINRMQSYHLLYDVPQQDKEDIRIRLSFIRKSEYIFSFIALGTTENFSSIDYRFLSTVASFNDLKDRAHLDRKPQRLKLVRTNGTQSVREIFRQAGMRENIWTKIAMFNGMELNQIPPKDKLVKIVK